MCVMKVQVFVCSLDWCGIYRFCACKQRAVWIAAGQTHVKASITLAVQTQDVTGATENMYHKILY